mmetsp:Transcript_195/g.818  ORF Transcript_195/g.818 Transcript_195/m.818 type:complete len:242 (+) Transcript_195:346-1071(+)
MTVQKCALFGIPYFRGCRRHTLELHFKLCIHVFLGPLLRVPTSEAPFYQAGPATGRVVHALPLVEGDEFGNHAHQVAGLLGQDCVPNEFGQRILHRKIHLVRIRECVHVHHRELQNAGRHGSLELEDPLFVEGPSVDRESVAIGDDGPMECLPEHVLALEMQLDVQIIALRIAEDLHILHVMQFNPEFIINTSHSRGKRVGHVAIGQQINPSTNLSDDFRGLGNTSRQLQELKWSTVGGRT